MFTVYDSKEDKYTTVEEPDPSLTYTYADYLEWKFEEQLELIRGRIYKMSAASNTRHQQLSIKLAARCFGYLEGKPCQVFAAPFDVRLLTVNSTLDTEVKTVVQPDLCIICDPLKIDSKGCVGAPDLVVEILSPGNNKKELKIKHELYATAGVKEYWIVYPFEECITAFILQDGEYSGSKIYTADDIIQSQAVPGLQIHINDLFI